MSANDLFLDVGEPNPNDLRLRVAGPTSIVDCVVTASAEAGSLLTGAEAIVISAITASAEAASSGVLVETIPSTVSAAAEASAAESAAETEILSVQGMAETGADAVCDVLNPVPPLAISTSGGGGYRHPPRHGLRKWGRKGRQTPEQVRELPLPTPRVVVPWTIERMAIPEPIRVAEPPPMPPRIPHLIEEASWSLDEVMEAVDRRRVIWEAADEEDAMLVLLG